MSGRDPQGEHIAELLAAQLPGARDAAITNLTRVFGGNARRAWSFDATWNGAQGATELPGIILTQAESGQLECDPDREYRILRGLSGSGVRAPQALAVDPHGDVLGAPSVVLERIAGTASMSEFLRPSDRERSRRLATDLAIAAAELHAADWLPTGLGDETAGLEPRDPAAAQVDYWERLFTECRYEPHPAMCSLFGWLHRNLPTPAGLSVVHGDLRPGNFLHRDGQLTALLDWEMAHLGDPAEDLAWAYRPLWSPEPFLSLDAFLATYNERAATVVARANVDYYRVFSEIKFATISLRAARAFGDGSSTNLRLADRAAMVTSCLTRALRWTEEAGNA